jgi:gluconolactonase
MANGTLLGLCITGLLGAAAAIAQETDAERETVTAGAIKLQVPRDWKQTATTSRMRLAQFEIPNPQDDGENAELVVFYFGGPTGGVKANIQRWISQFAEEDREVKVVRGTCRDGSYVLADISGTWKKPVGPPFARQTVETPGSRVIGAILIEKKADGSEDYYFLKLSGPDALVKEQATALRKSFAADLKSERPAEIGNDAE